MSAHAAAANPSPVSSAFASGARPSRHRRLLRHVLNLDGFEAAVRRRLPRAVHGYVSGGAESGIACRNDREAFLAWHLVTRILRDVSRRSQAVTLFGRRYASPFAIAPMGASAVVGDDADNRMARAARAANVPSVLSANSITPMEELARHNPDAWFAAYQQPDATDIAGMCERVAAAGRGVFMLTVDVPVGSNRENTIRTGYTMPLRVSPRLAFDGLTHPSWLAATAARIVLRRGIPAISNIGPRDHPSIFSRKLGGVTGHAAFSWRQAELIRRHWRGPFVLKGILSKEDARIARARHRRHRRVQPWRAAARRRGVADGGAGRRQGRERRHDGVRRQRLPARHGRPQGAGAGGRLRAARPAVPVRRRPCRPGRRRARDRAAAQEIDTDMALLGLADVAETGPEILLPVRGGRYAA